MCPQPACVRARKSRLTSVHQGAQRVGLAGFGAAVERFTWMDVFVRDNGRCYLCGLATLGPYDTGLDPASPVLDHVVPINLGGSHFLDNVALAHRECNGVKRNRTVEEARALIARREQLVIPVQSVTSVPLVEVLADSLALLSVIPRERDGGVPLVSAVSCAASFPRAP